jgi:hypothetical protein
MNIFVVFEVSDKIDLVQEKLFQKEYFDFWISNKILYPFPNNCVWKKNSDLLTGLKDIENIIDELNNSGNQIILKSCIVLSAQPWEGKASEDKISAVIARKGQEPHTAESLSNVQPPSKTSDE